MFKDCESLETIKFPSVTCYAPRTGCMFEGCNKLTTLTVNNFILADVEYIGGMFKGCSKLKHLDFSFICGDNVMTVKYMFSNCDSLTNVYLEQITLSEQGKGNVAYMFSDCGCLEKVYVNKTFYTQTEEKQKNMLMNSSGEMVYKDIQ